MNQPASIDPATSFDPISALHRAALRLYPHPIRTTFGAEMHAVFEEALGDARKRGPFAVLGLIWRETTDWPACLLREHIACQQPRPLIHGEPQMTTDTPDRCVRCGIELAAEHRFCPRCGTHRLSRRVRLAAWLDQLVVERPSIIALIALVALLLLASQANHLVTRVGLFARWSYPLAAIALAAGSAGMGFAVAAPGRRARRLARACIAIALGAAALGAIQLGDNQWLRSRSGTEHHEVFVLPGMRLESAAVADETMARAITERYSALMAGADAPSNGRPADAVTAWSSVTDVRRLKMITQAVEAPNMVVGILVSSAPDALYLIVLFALAVACAGAGWWLSGRRAHGAVIASSPAT